MYQQLRADPDTTLQIGLLTIPFIETRIDCINYQTECLNRLTDRRAKV